MAVVTIKGHVSRALEFYSKTDLFIGIGKQTPWANESLPPVPLMTDDLLEPVGYKKVETRGMVIPDEAGDIIYRGQRWRIVPLEDAISLGARWVYMACWISYDELPVNVSYRQLACIKGVVPIAGLPSGQYTFLPSQVSNVGITEILSNEVPTYRSIDKREKLAIIAEF